jgi:hypothetical protein
MTYWISLGWSTLTLSGEILCKCLPHDETLERYVPLVLLHLSDALNLPKI